MAESIEAQIISDPCLYPDGTKKSRFTSATIDRAGQLGITMIARKDKIPPAGVHDTEKNFDQNLIY